MEQKDHILRPALILVVLLIGLVPASGIGIAFRISMKDRAGHLFHVQMECRDLDRQELLLIMPTWTPGYYQLLDFGKNVRELTAKESSGTSLEVERESDFSWRISGFGSSTVIVEYDVLADRNFVANPYLDEQKAYMVPSGLCLYPDGGIDTPVDLFIEPDRPGLMVATGLDPIQGEAFGYTAGNYDVLYDSPLLAGELETLPSFSVRGIPHHFMALDPGEFDRDAFIHDLSKIVEAAVELIGHIPYEHYTFIGIGPGRGGIEHGNSTTVSFRGVDRDSRRAYLDQLFFLAHEYFHTYNVKCIRPVELGPFDYVNGSRTELLWVSEGLTVYYEYLILKRAGLCSEEELLQALQRNISALQNRPGRFVQTLAEASYDTWRDGPFGNMGDGADKTISYYDKGPLVGLFLDLGIRKASANSGSLDEVMRYLYDHYYLKLGRGFTGEEFRSACEEMAGIPLEEIFEFVYTTRELEYDRYLGYAGYVMDPSDFSIRKMPRLTESQRVVRSGWLEGDP